MEKRLPVHVVKFGKVQASVWANETKHGRRFNVTASRLYLEDGEWMRSDSFGRDELLTVSKALEAAFFWIWEHGQPDTRDGDVGTDEQG